MAASVVSTKCVFFGFLLIFHVSNILGTQDLYLYELESPYVGIERLDFVPLSDSSQHEIRKREYPSSTEKSISDNRSNPQQVDSNTTETAPPKISKNKMQKTTPTSPSITVNQPLAPFVAKNLGVNGTGIRKNISTTAKPINVEKSIPVPTSTLTVDVDTNSTMNEDNEFAISHFSDSSLYLNKTLKEHNISITRNDYHLYYNSSFKTDPETGKHYWVNMDNRSDVKINELLSRSHRRAATVKLSFDFPFYGHLIRNVTIATGGFLYAGDYVHSWLAMTQYIAPLMANFDTSLSNDSFIKYVDNGTAFTVQWENVSLQDKPNEGQFTFQATLLNNGDIIFVYKNVPLVIENIQDDHHPVKVGLSDAYLIEKTIFFVRRKTIYEYHRVNFQKEDIKNWTTIYLTALNTCMENKNCSSCVAQNIPAFTCHWCPSANRCSSGIDRYRQEWLIKECNLANNYITNETHCSQLTDTDTVDEQHFKYSHEMRDQSDHIINRSQVSSRIYQDSSVVVTEQPVNMGVSSIIAILFIIAMVSGLGVWVLYAYRNPHTTSGQILIRYRPSQWRWRRGEARYTAATIHM